MAATDAASEVIIRPNCQASQSPEVARTTSPVKSNRFIAILCRSAPGQSRIRGVYHDIVQAELDL